MNRRHWLRLVAAGAVGCRTDRAPARPAADFESLFDGRSLAGWTQVGGDPGTWRVEGGTLAAPRAGKCWLSTNRPYGDFDLRLDYLVERGGNSGILLRAPHSGDPSYEGLEVQILDDDARRYQGLRPDQYSGSVYGVVAARRGAVRPAGAWNRVGIALRGDLIAVDWNGVRVVDARLNGHPAAVRGRHPGLGRSRGFIGLQAHETPVRFRNVAIRELA